MFFLRAVELQNLNTEPLGKTACLNQNQTYFSPDYNANNLMSEVLSLVENVSGSTPAYNYSAFSQIAEEKFEKLKQAFVTFDKDQSGRIKTSGKIFQKDVSDGDCYCPKFLLVKFV